MRDPIASALSTARRYGDAYAAGGRIAASNINHNPTEAQKKAGNYAKDHVNIHGLDITIENAKGKPRRGVGKDGKPWSVTMPAHYGYIKKTKGADGDHVDCYVGPNLNSNRVFIVDQKDAEKGHFDEHKCMIGFSSRAEAETTYKRGFSDGKGHKRIGNVSDVSIDQFKKWLENGNTKNPVKKFASGGNVSVGDTSMEDALFDQETEKLKDQVRNREYPPEAYLSAKRMGPMADKGMIETPDYLMWHNKQNDWNPHAGNPPWTAGSFDDGGGVTYTGGSDMGAISPTGVPYGKHKLDLSIPVARDTDLTGQVTAAPNYYGPGRSDVGARVGLRTRFADGGEVDEPEPEASVPQDDPAALAYAKIPVSTKPTVMEPDLQSAQTGAQETPEGYAVNDAGETFNKQTGEVLKSTRRPSVLPLTKTPEGRTELAMPKVADIIGNMGAGWSVPVQGAEHILGAGLAVPKVAKTAEFAKQANTLLSPSEVAKAYKVGESKGTSPGGIYSGFSDGEDRYIKTAKSVDHATNEILASKLYELAGVPVAKTELTVLNGKPAIASHIVEGQQLSQHAPWQYQYIHNLQEHMPADAWLANGDVIGAGTENPKGNIIVGSPGTKEAHATRIDFGGALRYTGLGGLKNEKLWGNSVEPFLKGLKDENINPTAAEAFYGHEISPQNATAQRIANLDDDYIRNTVKYYGPADVKANQKLADTLIARKNDLAQQYGITSAKPNLTVVSKEVPLPAPPKMIANAMMKSFGSNVDPAHDMAETIWKLAEKHGHKQADAVVKELPHELWPDIDNNLSEKAHYAGYNPWPESRKFEPGPLQNPSSPAPQAIPKLMQINKGHSLPEVLHSIKKEDFQAVSDADVVTEKQQGNIKKILAGKTPEEIAGAMLDAQLTSKQADNILSWFPSNISSKIDKLYDNSLGGGLKPDEMFAKVFQQGLNANKPHWFEHFENQYQKFYQDLKGFYKLPDKSATQREADRIAGGFTTPAYSGQRVTHGNMNPFDPDERFHSDMLDVAHAYSVYKNEAAHDKWWDLNHPGVLSEYEHAAIQPLWLNTKDYVVVDAGGSTWSHANGMAWEARKKEMEMGRPEPKGAVIHNVNDMPAGGASGNYSHPSGEPFTVYQSWDPSTRRSKWARFDKENLAKTGLHLSIASGLIGGMGLAGSRGNGVLIDKQQQPQMRRGGRMPLIKSGSREAIGTNIKEMEAAGHPHDQSVAAALSTARKYGKARGGIAPMENMVLKGSSIKLGREGMINSSIPGRTDKIPMKVQAGSYVLPADIPSALGQGNTMAGGEILKKMFSSGPYGMAPMKGGGGGRSGSGLHLNPQRPPKNPFFAKGGEAEEGDDHVPIIAAGGEYIVHPSVVKDIGHGDVKKGHDVLDKFVLQVRKHHIKTLQKLPGPKR